MNAIIEQAQQQLNALAEHLLQAQDAILDGWRERVDRDPALSTSSRLTREQFIDHIPFVLDALCTKLRSWPNADSPEQKEKEQEAAKSHSQHRWQQGYDMRSLASEWGHLNSCLVQEFDSYGSRHSDLESVVLPEARRALAELINESITQSVVEYYHLLQAEAATRMRDLEAGLEHLREMEHARGQLLRTTAHDLKGSLSVVTGSADLMDDERLNETERDEMKQMLHRGVSTLQQMLMDLMDMARLEAGQETRKIETFDAGQLLSDLCSTSQGLAESDGLYLNAEGPSTLKVEGDAVKVRRIAQNLLLNGIKYTHQGGVSATWAEHEGERWMLCIQDTGPGLEGSTAAPLARKLEEATETAQEVEGGGTQASSSAADEKINVAAPTKTSTHGEGVGLSIVKRLCELLDATLELESKANVGTTFRVLFPLRYK
jgi:signal transduction histidine kinase